MLSRNNMLTPPLLKDRRMIVYGAAALALLAVTIVFFASRGGESFETITVRPGTFTQRVSSSGKVEPVSRVNLGFSTSGRVSGVYVAVGNRVYAGQVLAEVENGDARGALLEAQAKLRSLEIGTRPEEIAVSRAEVASAESSLTQAIQSTVEAMRDALVTAEDAVYQDTDQFVSNARSSNPSLTFTVSSGQIPIDFKNARMQAGTFLTSWASLVEGLMTSGDVYAAASASQTYLAEVSRLLSLASTALTLSSESSNVTRATLNGYVSDISAARGAIEDAASALTTAVTAQKSASAKLEIAKRTLALKEAGTNEPDIEAQAARVASARAQLEKTLIRSPFSGIITAVDAKVGAVSAADVPAISMISDGGFKIESYVPEINIAEIAVGDSARITLDAYGEGAPFEATVALVDPAETVRDGVSTYRVTLHFVKPDERIRAGMTANVVITTEEKTGIVSIPLGAVTTAEGVSSVRVLENGVPVERTVTTGGVSYLGTIEILSGLTEGDTVVVDALK